MVRLLLGLLLAATFFFSCSSRSDQTITIWAHFDPPEKKLVQKQLNQFAGEHPDWTFRLLTFSSQEIKTLYPLAVIGGSGPSILYGSTTDLGQLSELNVLEPLETHFDSTFLSGFTTLTLDPLVKIKNQSTGQIHLYQIADQVVNQVFLLYNKDLLSVHDDSNNSINSISMFSKTNVLIQTKAEYDLVWDYTNPVVAYCFLSAQGGQLVDQYNQPQLDSPQAVKSLNSLNTLITNGLKLPVESNIEQARLLFCQKKSPMIIDGLFQAKEFEKTGMKVGVIGIPKLDDDLGNSKPFVSGNGYSINPALKTKQKEMAVKLINYLCSKGNQLERVNISFNLPMRTEAFNDSTIQQNPVFQLMIRQVLQGTPQPSTPEANIAMQELASGYSRFLKDRTCSPEEAANKMQSATLNLLRTIRR